MTIRDVAQLLGVGWDMVKAIQKRYLKKRYRQPKFGNLRRIAIDEIAIGRGHRYLTIVLDLISGAVVFVGDGKGSEALDPFWRRLKRSRASIEAVAIDMSPSYIRAVSDHLPKATLVFDHFHIIKLYNDGLSDLRRRLHRETQDEIQQKVLKGTRWLLLKGAERLNPDKDEADRLKQALKINEPLATAYYLKEDLRRLWQQPDKRRAAMFLKGWIERAKAANVSFLKRISRTFEKLRKGILAYYDYRISTGPLEGTNNKIKTLQRQAYGFRDMDFFKLKIYALHLSRYALVG
jgi:transposase